MKLAIPLYGTRVSPRFGSSKPVLRLDDEGCGLCVHFCPAEAIEMQENVCGEWFISDTRYGPFVHARLGIAAKKLKLEYWV